MFNCKLYDTLLTLIRVCTIFWYWNGYYYTNTL